MELIYAYQQWPYAQTFRISRGASVHSDLFVAWIRHGPFVGRGECGVLAQYGHTAAMLREAFDGQEPRVFQTKYDEGVMFVIGPGLSRQEARRIAVRAQRLDVRRVVLLGGLIALWRDAGIFLVAGAANLLGLLAMRRVPETRGVTVAGQRASRLRWWANPGILVPCLGVAALGVLPLLEPHPVREPEVEVVVCFRDRPDLLRRSVRSLLDVTAWDRLRVRLVDNGSESPATARLVDELAREGSAILRFRTQTVNTIVGFAHWGEIGGHRVPIVNATAHWSDVGEALLNKSPEAPFVGAWFEDADGVRRWSLRSRPDFDVSEVAKKLGGKIDAIPGHPNHTWYEIDKPGAYTGQCAEFCGIQHAAMTATVEAVPARKFDSWLAGQARAQDSGRSDLGAQEFNGVCAKCHGDQGQGGRGPNIANSAPPCSPCTDTSRTPSKPSGSISFQSESRFTSVPSLPALGYATQRRASPASVYSCLPPCWPRAGRPGSCRSAPWAWGPRARSPCSP